MSNLSKSLEDTIKKDTLASVEKDVEDILIEISEKILDEVQHTISSEIPIIKTLLIAPKVINGISNYLLAKKIARFLIQLDSVSQKKRQEFLNEMDAQKKQEILENLILVLDRVEHIQKAEIIGKLFRSLINRDIGREEFDALVYATNMIDIAMIPNIISYYKTPNTFDNSVMYHFLFLGLVDMDSSTIGQWSSKGIIFRENNLGESYTKIITS